MGHAKYPYDIHYYLNKTKNKTNLTAKTREEMEEEEHELHTRDEVFRRGMHRLLCIRHPCGTALVNNSTTKLWTKH